VAVGFHIGSAGNRPPSPQRQVQLIETQPRFGRQPFIVFGLLRTADVASTVPGSMIALTLTLYVTVYLALIVAYIGVLKYMAEKPDDSVADEPAPVALPARSAP
jgi:cytochrome bd-type quinol oxidase subunit 1